MEKITVILILMGLFFAPSFVLACSGITDQPACIEEAGCGWFYDVDDGEWGCEDVPDVIAVLERTTNWLLLILGSLAAIMIVVAGIMFATARGNEEQVKKAKGILTYAIVGLVVALVARGIVALVSYLMRN